MKGNSKSEFRSCSEAGRIRRERGGVGKSLFIVDGRGIASVPLGKVEGKLVGRGGGEEVPKMERNFSLFGPPQFRAGYTPAGILQRHKSASLSILPDGAGKDWRLWTDPIQKTGKCWHSCHPIFSLVLFRLRIVDSRSDPKDEFNEVLKKARHPEIFRDKKGKYMPCNLWDVGKLEKDIFLCPKSDLTE